jgi:hypothetical protein
MGPMSIVADEAEQSPDRWWKDQRYRYNLTLISAAPVSFMALLLVWLAFGFRFPCLDITFFVIFFGALFFIILLPIANVCYALGLRTERRFGPQDPLSFRQRLYWLGTGFFLFIIYLPVLVSLIWTATGHPLAEMC